MQPLWTAHLNPHSPRYKDWQRILGSDDVPLLDPKTYRANFGKEESEVEIHKLDWQGMSVDQKDRLVAWVAQQFNVHRAEARAELNQRGFPIRAADVIVAFSLRAII
jgi:hypothetical protein